MEINVAGLGELSNNLPTLKKICDDLDLKITIMYRNTLLTTRLS